jgi:hypothetical protein
MAETPTRDETERRHRERVAKALALLDDPYAYADEMRECVFSNDRLGLDAVFGTDVLTRYAATRDDAFAAIRQSAATPGADTVKASDVAEDAVNHLVFAYQDLGMMMGVALEQLRRSVLATYRALKTGDGDRALGMTEEAIATLRTALAAQTQEVG